MTYITVERILPYPLSVLKPQETRMYPGPYKSALIVTLLLSCAQGTAIEERRNRQILFSIAALLYCGAAIEERHNRRGIWLGSIAAIEKAAIDKK